MDEFDFIASCKSFDYSDIMHGCTYESRLDLFVCDVLVVIPVRGRVGAVKSVIPSINKACGNLKVGVILVEHSHEREHYVGGADYVWIKCDEHAPFNKCLAFNIGVLRGICSQWILAHDADCMVQEHFFEKLFRNIEFKKTIAIQPFYNNRVLYCDDILTNKLLNKQVDINVLNEGSKGIFTVPGKAMGGSLMMTRDLFIKVGGYDPDLFTGYSPEDQFMWAKLSLFTDIPSCYNPRNEVFHLHHERMNNTNPELKRMIDIHHQFMALTTQDKLQIINIKSEILKQWF